MTCLASMRVLIGGKMTKCKSSLCSKQSGARLVPFSSVIPIVRCQSAQVWEISTTISSLVGGGLLQMLEGSAIGLWHLRAIGTRVGDGACILGGSRWAPFPAP